MITKEEYLNNPCGTLSIPYWKQKYVNTEKYKIVHQKELCNKEVNCEKYFRLIHDLKNIEFNTLQQVEFKVIDPVEFSEVESIINQCYETIQVNLEQIITWTKTEVYDSSLWLFVIDKKINQKVGCIIAEYDKELNEGVIEWLQVLPNFRRRGFAQGLINQVLTLLSNKAKFVTVSGSLTNKHNPELVYRKCGFKGEDIWCVFTG